MVIFLFPDLFKLIFFAFIIVNIFFILSFHQTARRIPKNFHDFPIWFCWLFILPLFGIIFKWIMLPFALPQALRTYKPKNEQVQRVANKLFGIGIAHVITLTLCLFFDMMGFFIFAAAIILLILYWSEIVNVRKQLSNDD